MTIIIPDVAKSAGTLLALGSHHILMSPMSDLGPIDPQFWEEGELVAAKDIIAAVDYAALKIQESPETYPLYISLLSDVSGIKVQQARAALDSTEELLCEALRSNPDRDAATVEKLSANLTEVLIRRPRTHSALFGFQDAIEAGLPADTCDLDGQQWKIIWSLWTKYYSLMFSEQVRGIYEGRSASLII